MNDSNIVVTRRDFVRGTVLSVIGASVTGTTPTQATSGPTRSSTVTLVRDQEVVSSNLIVDRSILKQMLSDCLQKVTGKKTEKESWLSLLNPTDSIGLVSTPHLNPTHKELVEAVKASLLSAGISENQIRMAQGGPEQAKACTALIALPALKAHWLTGIGTVLKNYITFSGKPQEYHDSNNAKLGEIWNMPHVKGKTKLVLVDAIRPLCDKGPQPDPRYMWNYGGLIAGTDPVAVEAVCLKVITEKRRALRGEAWPISPPPLCVEMADQKYGLGTSRLEEIKIERIGWALDSLV